LYAGGFTFSQLTEAVKRKMLDWLEVNRTRSNMGVRVEAFRAIKDCHKYAGLDLERLPRQTELFAQELHSTGFEIVGLVDGGNWLVRLGNVFALLMYLVPATQLVALCEPGEYAELQQKAAYVWHSLGLSNLEVGANV
jgi:hypothetical protein